MTVAEQTQITRPLEVDGTETPPFCCPRCRTTLGRRTDSAEQCGTCGAVFRMEGGIRDMLLPERRHVYDRFLAEYGTIRRAEGRTGIEPGDLRKLPYPALAGRAGRDWKIRARSFDAFVDRVIRPLESAYKRPLRILDLGAGSGWLSYRMARRGHAAVAVDLQTDDRDGLGACAHYDARMTAVRAEFDALPFPDGSFDAVVFNASLHYSTDYERTLRESFRVLNDGGRCVIIDSPVYRDPNSGAEMVRERERDFTRRFGFPSNSIPSENYLTWDRLGELATLLRIDWHTIRPKHGMRWRLRPLVARMLRRREPASFVILVAGKSHRTHRPAQTTANGFDLANRVAKHALTAATHRMYRLPVLILMPHSRCNCRCVMCDIWKANGNGRELSPEDLAPHIDSMKRLDVRHVVLSGGEPLMHTNLWTLCEALKTLGVKITLLSTGLLLKRYAAEIREWCDEVIVSLDGSRDVHNRIRNIPNAYEKLAAGVAALKGTDGAFPVSGRCVIQRGNYFDLPNIVSAARELGLDRISFFAADVFSSAFNRPVPWPSGRASEIALTESEADVLESLIDRLVTERAEDFASGFIAESEAKLHRIPAYFRACHGNGDFPPNKCNAPWMSAVVETDGAVRPCFFHKPIGNVFEQPLHEIVNGPAAVSFRKNLQVGRDPVCRKCVATLCWSPVRES